MKNSNKGPGHQPLTRSKSKTNVSSSASPIKDIDQEISIRFKLKSDGGLRRDGFYYDDFKIRALSSSLSSSENTLNKAKIYPIPADNMIYISSEQEIKEIKVFDVLGKEIMFFDQNNIENFSIENLKSGVYIIKLFSLEGTENHRIIKK